MDPQPLYSEYRSRRFPVTSSFFLEHQKFQAEYAALAITGALVVGYFQLLDHRLSGYGLIFLVFATYMVVNAISVLIMDTVIVELYVSPVGISFHSLLQVVRGTRPERILRILNVKHLPDAVQITTDDRTLTFRRRDWPKFDDLVADLEDSHENGFRERYRVFR